MITANDIDDFIDLTMQIYKINTSDWAGPTLDYPACMEKAKEILLGKEQLDD